MMRRLWVSCALGFVGIMTTIAATTVVMASEVVFYGETDKDAISYTVGEKMAFSVELREDGTPISGKTLRWERRGDDGVTTKGEVVSDAEKPLVVETSIDRPGFVRLIVQALEPDGTPVMTGEGDKRRPIEQLDLGAGAEWRKLEGYAEPDDFDAYWAGQKARLAEVPLRADMVPVACENEKVELFDVKIDCIGKPVSGYFGKPKDAKPGTLPAHVSFHGYGVGSANRPTWATNAMMFDVNAHGIENGREPEYYTNLQNGELQGYAFDKTENQKPETAYFNGMFLRLIRALEWIKSQPEWDGKTLIVSGGSQGGLQCLSAAGLDEAVTECQAHVPWCCNLGCALQGRQNGWFPEYTPALGYFDAANHAKRIKGKVFIYAGLGDYVCPPSTEAVLFNNIRAEKTLEFSQGRTHGYIMPNGKKTVVTE